MNIDARTVENAIKRALAEDLGGGRDITTAAAIPPGAAMKAVMRARREGILCGGEIAAAAFRAVDPSLKITAHIRDGGKIAPGQDILSIEGPAASILTAERTALNFATHLSGISTMTGKYVEAVAGTKASIMCTRKTLPGLRIFQKYAVRCGGGRNHRFGLYDAVLIKDNHIAAAGGVGTAIEKALSFTEKKVKIEVEVDTMDQLKEALQHDIDVVLLDNMPADMLRLAVKMAKGKCLTEASGGITLRNVRAAAQTGVDMISIGALTHSAPALDIGLDTIL
ncbi:MAG: carboxylating nicotinate-nucleotide diphosphorylase [Proteobacteria bacterium]|nr:carboxylating nicotinate-nucleotide diphosphorylase [Pseudomonadota bacterium]